MSKQSEAKERQNYRREHRTCSTCEHFSVKVVTKSYGSVTYNVEGTLRCTLGGFAVKKTATCDDHKEKA